MFGSQGEEIQGNSGSRLSTLCHSRFRQHSVGQLMTCQIRSLVCVLLAALTTVTNGAQERPDLDSVRVGDRMTLVLKDRTKLEDIRITKVIRDSRSKLITYFWYTKSRSTAKPTLVRASKIKTMTKLTGGRSAAGSGNGGRTFRVRSNATRGFEVVFTSFIDGQGNLQLLSNSAIVYIPPGCEAILERNGRPAQARKVSMLLRNAYGDRVRSVTLAPGAGSALITLGDRSLAPKPPPPPPRRTRSQSQSPSTRPSAQSTRRTYNSSYSYRSNLSNRDKAIKLLAALAAHGGSKHFAKKARQATHWGARLWNSGLAAGARKIRDALINSLLRDFFDWPEAAYKVVGVIIPLMLDGDISIGSLTEAGAKEVLKAEAAKRGHALSAEGIDFLYEVGKEYSRSR